jgi:uncharacterized protein YfkK (UPF0435 family)
LTKEYTEKPGRIETDNFVIINSKHLSAIQIQKLKDVFEIIKQKGGFTVVDCIHIIEI